VPDIVSGNALFKSIRLSVGRLRGRHRHGRGSILLTSRADPQQRVCRRPSRLAQSWQQADDPCRQRRLQFYQGGAVSSPI
jgi:hypothetical protein